MALFRDLCWVVSYGTGTVRLLSFRLLLHVLADGLHVLENYLALVVG